MMSRRKLTVTGCGDAHLVLSVRAQTGQAAAQPLGVGAEAVARLEARPARHRAPTPGGPRRPLAVDWRGSVCMWRKNKHVEQNER